MSTSRVMATIDRYLRVHVGTDVSKTINKRAQVSLTKPPAARSIYKIAVQSQWSQTSMINDNTIHQQSSHYYYFFVLLERTILFKHTCKARFVPSPGTITLRILDEKCEVESFELCLDSVLIWSENSKSVLLLKVCWEAKSGAHYMKCAIKKFMSLSSKPAITHIYNILSDLHKQSLPACFYGRRHIKSAQLNVE